MNPFKMLQHISTWPLISRIIIALTVILATSHLSVTGAFAAQTSLTWAPPTTYTDGTPLTNLGGYKIYLGTTSGSYSQNIDVGNVTSYSLGNLNDGTTYYFAVTAYNTAGNVSGYSNQATYTTPAAPPSSTTYTITASAGSGGSISPSGAVAISQGLSQSFTITPSSGYKIAGVTVDGASVGAVSSYAFTNVAANHTISASFASTSTSASLTSSTTWQNQAFASQSGVFTASFDMIPNANNSDAVTMLCPGAATAYTNGAAIVRFNTAGTIDARNGSAYAAGVSVPYTAGSTYHVRMTVNVPNHVYDVYVTPPGGSEVHLAAGYAFRTEQATVSSLNNLGVFADIGSHQVLNFAVTPQTTSSYSLSASAGTGGSISPAGTTTVNSGGSQTYTITPAAGYQVSGVTVDGVSVGAVTSYSFSNVSANHTIAVSFKATSTASYTISAKAYTRGSISPSGTVTVTSGASKTFTITPSAGYQVSAVKVDGVSVGPVTSYTFSNVTANHTIAVSFK